MRCLLCTAAQTRAPATLALIIIQAMAGRPTRGCSCLLAVPLRMRCIARQLPRPALPQAYQKSNSAPKLTFLDFNVDHHLPGTLNLLRK